LTFGKEFREEAVEAVEAVVAMKAVGKGDRTSMGETDQTFNLIRQI